MISYVSTDIYKKRSLDCEIVEGKVINTIEEYAKLLKDDWEVRANENPTLYVMAESNAREFDIFKSGLMDFCNEYWPRVKPYLNTKQSKVLEIGCGVGRMSYFIASSCTDFTGVDISKNLLQKARERMRDLSNWQFYEVEGFSLNNIKSNQFDIVFEYIVFQHIPSKDIVKNYIKEMCRVLVQGGHAIFHGRDVDGIKTEDNFTGNTWHGSRMSPQLVREGIVGTSCTILAEEGIGTDRYWVTLEKKIK